MTILIVEDDANVADGLREILTGQGYRTEIADNSADALKLLQAGSIDLAILDVSLGGDSGFDLCRRLRRFSEVPVLFLTACTGELELLRGFQAGGDDYVGKPFRMQELLMRIQALLRRSGKHREVLHSGDLTFDHSRLRRGGCSIELTATERKLLSALITSFPRVLTREELLYQVWDKDADFVEANTLNVNISRLREKLGQDYIETVRGVGYRWAVQVVR